VEVRALDVSAFDPVGVNQNKLRFLEVFLALCLMKDSPPIATWEHDTLDANHVIVARRGREPGLKLQRDGRAFPMHDWARELVDSMQGIAEVFDRGDPAKPYSGALAAQAAKIDNVALTPSARMLAELESTGESFFELALRMSRLHKEYFLALESPNAARLAEFKAAAEESLRAQTAVEAADRISFEEYLSRYAAG
jgi:glutamate--cysteine ligase